MKKRTWGGRREGAGRKAKYAEPLIAILARLPRSLVKRLNQEAAREQESRNDVIIRRLGWTPKKGGENAT